MSFATSKTGLLKTTSPHPMTAWFLLIVVALLAIREIRNIYQIWDFNNMIENPAQIANKTTDLPPEVVFARAFYLNSQGEYQQALRLYLAIEKKSSKNFRNKVQYNMGTIYLEQAAKLWNAKGVWEYSQINTFLDLAEQNFRDVLVRQPDLWPARYNLEYTLHLRPPAKEQEKADWQGHKSSVHAIYPGIPEGGP